MDSHLLGLNIAAEQQHSIISQWECKNNKLYKSNKNIANMRPITGVQMMEEVEDDGKYEMAKTKHIVIGVNRFFVFSLRRCRVGGRRSSSACFE